jgi:hypothetical protein
MSAGLSTTITITFTP